jgi:uncharacterized membrane protein YgcG
MKRALLGAAVAMGMMVFAAPALASATDPGWLEICKTSTGLTGTPSFTFHVSGHADVTVANNSCSTPFQVPSGNVTVQEVSGSFYTVSSISTAPGSALISSNPKGSGALNSGPNGTALVSVAASSDPSTATTVNYTNIPVDGYIEVCKNNASDAGLTGNFTFTITGNNAFSTTTSVPIGHCSLPILVPAGVVNVAEAAPNSITGITVQNGAPSATLADGSENVTVKPAPSAGDTSQEAIVSFANETVQLKICKVAADSGVTAPYTFTAVGTGDPSFPGGISRTVTVLPGQCQLVPGPYTNPNGTTGWRAGTTVTVSEGVVPGTAVTAIAVTPSNREVSGAKTLSPLPNPTTPGPAGQDAVILGSGETDMAFTNASEPGGTLKVCENVDSKAPASAVETFTVSSPTPAGSTTTAAVPFGSCTIVPNPVTSDGLWLYNSTVTIAQQASTFPFASVAVSPTARLLTPAGASIGVAIGSGDTTIATYTNDPPGSGGSSGGGGSAGGGSAGGGSAGGGSAGGVTIGGSTVIAAVSGTTAAPGSSAAKSHTQLRSAKLVKIHGHVYLVVRVASTNKSARIRIVELNKSGHKIRTLTMTISTNRSVRLTIPLSSKVKVAEVKLA